MHFIKKKKHSSYNHKFGTCVPRCVSLVIYEILTNCTIITLKRNAISNVLDSPSDDFEMKSYKAMPWQIYKSAK